MALCELRFPHAHLWARSPGAAGTSSGPLSLLPLGGKAVLSDSTVFASPAHTLCCHGPQNRWTPETRRLSPEAKQTSKESRGKTEHWKKLNRPADRGAQKVFMIVEKLHSDSYVSGGDP